MTEQKRMGRWYFGGLASAGAACCTHPLDLIKVGQRGSEKDLFYHLLLQVQLQTKKDGNIGALAQAKIIIRWLHLPKPFLTFHLSWKCVFSRSEGFLALYNGLSASLVRQLTYSTTRFAIYEVRFWNEIGCDIYFIFRLQSSQFLPTESRYPSPGGGSSDIQKNSIFFLQPSFSRLGMAAVAGACGGFIGTPGDMTNVRW